MFHKSYLFILATLFLSCEEAPDLGPDELLESPEVSNLSETIFDDSSVQIDWTGNESARIFYYRMDYLDEYAYVSHSWDDWDTTSATSVHLYGLDEGNYTFHIKGSYDISTFSTEETLYFAVDAISGPAMRIYPLNQTANVGDTINVYLYFEEVPIDSAVTGLHMEIQIDQNKLEFISEYYDKGELLIQFEESGGLTLWLDPKYSDNNTTMLIDVGVVGGIGLSGTGSLIKFSLKVLASAGTYNIDIGSDGTLLDKDSNPIEFGDPVSGSVTVE